MGGLHTIETLNFVILHSVHVIGLDRWDSLDKADHCLITMSLEFIIIARLKRLELVGAVLGRISRDIRLNRVLKVSKEAKTIIKINLEGLIVDR